MSKATKIILSGLVAAGLVVTYAVVSTATQNYVIQTYAVENDRSVYCYDGYNAVSVVVTTEGDTLGAYAHKCGFGNDFYQLDFNPNVACNQSSATDKVSCLIDEVTQGDLSEFEISQFIVESWVSNDEVGTLQNQLRQQEGYRGVCGIAGSVELDNGGFICQLEMCSGGIREFEHPSNPCTGTSACNTFEGSVDTCAGSTTGDLDSVILEADVDVSKTSGTTSDKDKGPKFTPRFNR